MVAGGLESIRSRMAEAAGRSGRSVQGITLVAVSKGRGVSEMMEAYEAGQRDFGENRALEMSTKVSQMPGDVRWHFVGSLQSRKVPLVAPDCYLLHSMDRVSLGKRWATASPEPPPCLLQVNIAREPQKHGVEAQDVAQSLDGLAAVDIRPGGLMVIPPPPQRPEDSRRWFAALRSLRDDLGDDWPSLTELSMGMTDDFETAIEEGATIIRVGRAIFEAPA